MLCTNCKTQTAEKDGVCSTCAEGSRKTILEYYINKDERGEFNADVRDLDGNTLVEWEGCDHFEDGWIKHKDDLSGILDYLSNIGYDISQIELVKGN